MASQQEGLDIDPTTITEEKRTAILGAMKNFKLDYMPQWATIVPEDTWMSVLTSDVTAKEHPK